MKKANVLVTTVGLLAATVATATVDQGYADSYFNDRMVTIAYYCGSDNTCGQNAMMAEAQGAYELSLQTSGDASDTWFIISCMFSYGAYSSS
jgi:hypothetical protein